MSRPPLGPAEIIVDLAAIRANARLLAATAGVALIAVVKADGYGHGTVESARAALDGGATWLATATVEEALALRAAGVVDVPLLCWLTAPGSDLGPGSDLAAAVAADVDVTAYSVEELDAIAVAVGGGTGPARVQLKVDTGLSRGGAPRSAWEGLFARARAGEQEGIWRITGVWSHFACADDPAHPANDPRKPPSATPSTSRRSTACSPRSATWRTRRPRSFVPRPASTPSAAASRSTASTRLPGRRPTSGSSLR